MVIASASQVDSGEEPLQGLDGRLLGADDRFGVGECGERLIALSRQEESFQIAAEGLALVALAEQVVELLGIGFQQTGGRGITAPPLCQQTTGSRKSPIPRYTSP